MTNKKINTSIIIIVLVVGFMLIQQTPKKEAVSFSSDSLSECTAKRQEMGDEACTDCYLYTSELANCYNPSGTRDDHIDNTYVFGYASNCDSSATVNNLKDCIEQLGLIPPSTYKVTILSENQLTSTGDIKILSSSVNFYDDFLWFFISVQNTGSNSKTFLVEMQPIISGLKQAIIRESQACDDACKENVHTLVSVDPGRTQQITIKLPKLANGEYDIQAISFDSCCPDNTNCQAVSPLYDSRQIIAKVKVENSDVTLKCSTPFCGDGICNNQETPSTCSNDCKTDCTPSTEICDNKDNDCDGQIDEDLSCDSKCEFWEDPENNCEVALWAWIVLGALGFILLISIMKKKR